MTGELGGTGRYSTVARTAAGRALARGAGAGQVFKWASLVGGGTLAVYGLAKRTRAGIGLALAGVGLIYRGAMAGSPLRGRSPVASVEHGQGIKVVKAVTINKAPEELYRFWRNFENLPRFMTHLREVRVLDDRRSRWVVQAPAGQTVEWDAEIHNEVENELIAWRSLPGADIGNAGSVRFSPAAGGRGAEVKVTLEYDPPAGTLGATIAKLFGEEPAQQVGDDLRRLKQLLEAGEVPTTAGQPKGK